MSDNRELDGFEAPKAVRSAVSTLNRGQIDTAMVEQHFVEPDLETLEAPIVTGHAGPTDEYLDELRAIAKRELEERGGNRLKPVRESLHVDGSAAWGRTTVSQSTLEAYDRRSRQLLARYLRESGLPRKARFEDVSLVEWINWALSLKPSIQASTWRQYRQSLLHALTGIATVDAENAISLLSTDIRERSIDAYSGRRSRARKGELAEKSKDKTSSRKEKRFSQHDFDRVLGWLRIHSRSKRSELLSDWLKAGVTTGLRPSEWRGTYLDVIEDPRTLHSRRVRLYVLNAKATNGRGPGDTTRTLDLSHYSDEDLNPIRRMVERGLQWAQDGTFRSEQIECSKLLAQVVRTLWPGRRYSYSLYSCRHQAIANWKNVMPQERVAAIAGHGSIVTAGENYGRRTSGWMPEAIKAPQPIRAELDLVSKRLQMTERRRENNRASRTPVPAPTPTPFS